VVLIERSTRVRDDDDDNAADDTFADDSFADLELQLTASDDPRDRQPCRVCDRPTYLRCASCGVFVCHRHDCPNRCDRPRRADA
jgi:hypothetical protein